MKQHLILIAAATLVPLGLTAQGTKKMVPNPGPQDGNGSAYYFSIYEAGRAQQTTLGSALCKNTSIILELAMRADGSNMAAQPIRMLVGY